MWIGSIMARHDGLRRGAKLIFANGGCRNEKARHVEKTSLALLKREEFRNAYSVFSISLMMPSSVRTAKSACSSSIMSGGQSRSVVSPEPRTSSPL